MILVDTSGWINHFRKTDKYLANLLSEESVLIHPFIVGELACGNIKNRKEILKLLQSLTQIKVTNHNEIIYFVEQNRLYGIGLGYIDVHLLASCIIDNAKLYTHDRKLKKAAKELFIL